LRQDLTLKNREKAMDAAKDMHELLLELERVEFTGVVRINYSQGVIVSAEKQEDILRKIASERISNKRLKS
jgi:hypothetical protein